MVDIGTVDTRRAVQDEAAKYLGTVRKIGELWRVCIDEDLMMCLVRDRLPETKAGWARARDKIRGCDAYYDLMNSEIIAIDDHGLRDALEAHLEKMVARLARGEPLIAAKDADLLDSFLRDAPGGVMKISDWAKIANRPPPRCIERVEVAKSDDPRVLVWAKENPKSYVCYVLKIEFVGIEL